MHLAHERRRAPHVLKVEMREFVETVQTVDVGKVHAVEVQAPRLKGRAGPVFGRARTRYRLDEHEDAHAPLLRLLGREIWK